MAVNLLQTVSPPGYGRAYYTTTVQVVRQGVLRPAAFANWEALVPGTENQYLGALYAGPFGEATLSFPQRTDERGLIQIWAPEPVRLELRVTVYGYPSVKQVADLQFTEDPGDTALDALAEHEAALDPHEAAGYITLAEANEVFLTPAQGDDLFLTQEEGDNRYAFAGLSGITQDAADIRYVNTAGDTMTGPLRWGATADTGDVAFTRTDPGCLRLDNALGIGITPPADLHPARRGLLIGDAAYLMGGLGYNALEIRVNSYQQADNTPHPFVPNLPAGNLQLVNETLTFNSAAPVASVATPQTWVQRLHLNANGSLFVNPEPGVYAYYTSSQAPGNVIPQPQIMISRVSPAAHGQWLEFQNGAAQGDYLIGRKPADDNLYFTFWNGVTLMDRARLQTDGTLVLGGDVSSTGSLMLHNAGIPEDRYMLSTAYQNDFTIQDMIRGGPVPFRISRLTNTVTLSPNSSQDALLLSASPHGVINSANTLILRAAQNIHVRPTGTLFGPETDGETNLGYSSVRWAQIWSTSPTISTSHVSAKEAFAPLDPAACAAAVLDTDWMEFDYKIGGDPEAAFSKRQRGYVLGSPAHRVSDLFGMADRHSASTHADLAVVACALQQALRRIAELEQREAR